VKLSSLVYARHRLQVHHPSGLRLRHQSIHSNLRRLRFVFSHSNIQLVEFRREETCPRTADRLDSTKLVIVVRIPLLEDRDPAFASYRIDPVTPLVVEDVVAIANGGQCRNPLALDCVQHDQACWKAGYHEQSVVLLVQSHRVVGQEDS